MVANLDVRPVFSVGPRVIGPVQEMTVGFRVIEYLQWLEATRAVWVTVLPLAARAFVEGVLGELALGEDQAASPIPQRNDESDIRRGLVRAAFSLSLAEQSGRVEGRIFGILQIETF